MRRFLVVTCLTYMSIAVIVGFYSIITQPDGGADDTVISYEVLDRAIRWPIRLFE